MPAPDSMLVEIEFTAGVWTDVSAYVDWTRQVTTKWGRPSPFAKPQVTNISGLTLFNDDGRFSPLRETLADGTTTHPYYPNVLPRKQIRISAVVTAVSYRLFTGRIKGWPVFLVDGFSPRVVLEANTNDDRLSRVEMLTPIRQEFAQVGPILYWPLTDAVGSTTAAPITGSYSLQLSSGTPVTFGSDGPGSGDGTGVNFPAGLGNQSLYVTGISVSVTAVTFTVAIKTTTVSQTVLTLDVNGATGTLAVFINGSGFVTCGGIATITGSHSVTDGLWHSLTVTVTAGGTFELWVDGTSEGTAAGTPITVVDNVVVGANFSGNAGQVAAFASVLSATRIASISDSVHAFVGETVDARIKRFLGYGGLTAADWNIDASTVTLGSYPQSGKDIVTACRDMADTEGGGAVFYFTPDGKARFTSRSFRSPGSPAWTIDCGTDIDGRALTPAFDDTQIVNEVQGQRATATTTASTQTADDTGSQGTYGTTTSSFTSYATDDADVLANAQDQLARQSQPAYRLGQIPVDLFTSSTAGIIAVFAAMEIGERIRLTNLYVAAGPASQVDVLLEGVSLTLDTNTFRALLDTSAADSPAMALYDDATYGRWSPDAGSMTVSGGITNSATTLVVITAGSAPTWSTAAGDYPLTVQIGQEQIRLNNAPGGAASPQTFTGITRGMNGTTAAAHAAGAVVDLAPLPTFAL
jgi:hypothetical protein